MTEFSDQDGGTSRPNPLEAPEPRYTLAVPESWAHYDGPLHGLLAFQDGKCAVCSTDVQWSNDESYETAIATNNLRQWVENNLLLGLVCYRCARRYKTLKKEAEGAAVTGLPIFLSNPPGQRCPQTVGLGAQSRPRRFNSTLMPTEVPTPGIWAYTGTVSHSLFLWQRGRCGICSTGLSVTTRPRYVHVDHDEATGLIRGLLCHRCNTCLRGLAAHLVGAPRLDGRGLPRISASPDLSCDPGSLHGSAKHGRSDRMERRSPGNPARLHAHGHRHPVRSPTLERTLVRDPLRGDRRSRAPSGAGGFRPTSVLRRRGKLAGVHHGTPRDGHRSKAKVHSSGQGDRCPRSDRARLT